ncbi:hypothetical protein P885DRAFT_82405 [Corynascus similis CBS 632.67]
MGRQGLCIKLGGSYSRGPVSSSTIKLVTSQISTLATHQTTHTSNALLTVAVSFLPFTLTALLLHAPPLNSHPPVPVSAEQQQQHLLTSARYLAASAIVSCAAAGVFLVVANWAAAGDKVGGVLQSVKAAVAGRERADGGGKFGLVAARSDKRRMRDEGGGGKGGWDLKTSGWLGWPWWAEAGADGNGKRSYKYLSEEVTESEDDGVGRGRGLPF